MQRSLFASDVSKKILSLEGQLILPAVCTKEALSVQIETVRLNGQATMETIETLVAMVSKLSREVAHLKIDNVELKTNWWSQRACCWTPCALHI
jgi:hypothetical protein